MSAKDLLKRIIRRTGAPLLEDVDARLDQRLRATTPLAPAADIQPFPLLLTMAARGIAASGPHHVPLPTEAARRVASVTDLKIGFFGNIANNAHNFTRCLRRLGYEAELVIQDGWVDTFVMNRPFWEDVDVECDSYDEALTHESRWVPPSWIRRVSYDLDLQVRYQNRLSAVSEVQALYLEAFGVPLASDRALLLAQNMGSWPYLLAMKRYDLIQFSASAIAMAPFCPRPHVVFPTGSDLYVSPFNEDVVGLLMRAGYRGASEVLVCEATYAAYLQRMQRVDWLPAPMMIDTFVYAPGDSEAIRSEWERTSGGSRFLLAACRHTWRWKGNDRLIRGFAEFAKGSSTRWRLVLQTWGDDVDRSKALAHELGVSHLLIWERLCSKPILRKKQRAADAAADQFVMPGAYGTSVLEAMAAGRAVIITPPPAALVQHLPAPPPFVGATDAASIAVALRSIDDDDLRRRRGEEHLHWLRRVHGAEAVSLKYLSAYERALRISQE